MLVPLFVSSPWLVDQFRARPASLMKFLDVGGDVVEIFRMRGHASWPMAGGRALPSLCALSARRPEVPLRLGHRLPL